MLEASGLSVVELGAAALFILLVLKLIHDIFKLFTDKKFGTEVVTKNGSSSVPMAIQQLGQDLAKVVQQVHDLHAWHDKDNDDGVKIWYNRRSIEALIKSTAEAQRNLTRLVEALIRMGESQTAAMTSIQQVLSDLYTNMTTQKEAVCPLKDSLEKSKSEE